MTTTESNLLMSPKMIAFLQLVARSPSGTVHVRGGRMRQGEYKTALSQVRRGFGHLDRFGNFSITHAGRQYLAQLRGSVEIDPDTVGAVIEALLAPHAIPDGRRFDLAGILREARDRALTPQALLETDDGRDGPGDAL
ncbi:hypothetical protein IB275_30380 [Pseudomonas sp. PDM21]|uniref:hypothetical protein n=1 Tax=Pseudomonas sp. PDM21 TaxID=2769257 RepID=UPI00177ECD0F|nr:hypothetical protein [Pseudomonas sp. PDM21]MBD9674923.1 hypothetical protein [Pseudomonas sp. PDM21]